MIADKIKQHPAHYAFLLIGLPFITTLLLLAGSFVFPVPGVSPLLSAHAAAMMQQKGTTCATASPDQQAALCNGLDPVAQGCIPTARTLQSVGIVDNNGNAIGRIDRRYSTQCNSYWARIFDYRQTPPPNTVLALHIGSLTPFATNAHELYSSMVYDTPRSPAPLIEGSLNADVAGSFNVNWPYSATIPQGETPPPQPSAENPKTLNPHLGG